MNNFLIHDWAGLVIATIIGLAGYLLWRLGRSRRSKWLRWPLTGISSLVLLAGVALFAGAIIHLVQIARLNAQYPMPGESFDVGGYRLHLMRQGENRVDEKGRTPTVVLISGGYAQGLALHHLYEALAKDTRTIIFDRAGAGWSERSIEPRTVRNDVADLKRLLDAAGEPGPFVLAGHSWGGLFAYQFAARYPDLTAGVVLLDATPFEMVRGEFAASMDGYGSLLKMSAFAQLFALDGLMWSMAGVNVSDPDKEGFLFKPLKDIWPMYRAGDVHVRAAISGAESMSVNVAASGDIVDEPGSLGDIPMLVIYQESLVPDQSKLTPEEKDQARKAGMRALGMTAEEYDAFMQSLPAKTEAAMDAVVALSRNSQLIHPPEGSTHQFPYEHPEWVADRIREMVERTSGSAGGSAGSAAAEALRTLADDIWAWYLEGSTYLRLQEGLPG